MFTVNVLRNGLFIDKRGDWYTFCFIELYQKHFFVVALTISEILGQQKGSTFKIFILCMTLIVLFL
jgi:hypothetical protein